MINQEKIKIINTLLKKYMKIEFNKIYNMDCMKGMKNISSNSVDLVVTDPPFAIEFGPKRSNYNRKESRVLKGYKEILKDDYYDFTINWMKEASRTLKDSGSMYIFSGWNNLKDILNSIDELGLTTVNHIIWKYQFGVVTKRKYVTSHYHCLYVCKNDKNRKFKNEYAVI
ncbi:MAG: methylase N-4/N-6 domain-containing protein [Parcubacteria group bacterium GW2011_GWA2_37_10]|nr:MAG: methylase N-4/N-6 domain-containing protein [Parcubacteria group bacterium GW2011_GWA2_37_10]